MAKAAACASDTVPPTNPATKRAISSGDNAPPSRFLTMISCGRQTMGAPASGAIGDPDILDLRRLAEEIVAGKARIGEVIGEAAAGPGLLEIADGGLFDHGGLRGRAHEPQPVDPVMLGQHLAQHRRV